MKRLFALILCLTPWLASAQNPLLRNFFDTNQSPIVDVLAGSNITVVPTTTGVDQRHFTVHALGAAGAATNVYRVSSSNLTVTIVTNLTDLLYDLSVSGLVTFNTNQFSTGDGQTNILNGAFTTNLLIREVAIVTNINADSGLFTIELSTNQAAMRLELAGLSPNITMGVNLVTNLSGPGNRGATISGGYNNSIIGNKGSGSYAAISGGSANTVTAQGGSIGGGFGNSVFANSGRVDGGDYNTVNNVNAAIGGGISNVAGGNYSTISGGFSNKTTTAYSVIGGGQGNVADGNASTISGGQSNVSSALNTFIGGGLGNNARGSYSAIVAGNNNYAYDYGTVGGGLNNIATNNAVVSGGVNNSVLGLYSVIAGGAQNLVASNYSLIGGGFSNSLISFASVICGGESNYDFSDLSHHGFIGGGSGNFLVGGENSVIAGGWNNKAAGRGAVVSGGFANYANGTLQTIGGGSGNYAQGDWGCVVAGGMSNRLQSTSGVIAGGEFNTCGEGLLAEGLSVIGGGFANHAARYFSIIGGGQWNTNLGALSIIASGEFNVVSNDWSVISGGHANYSFGGWNTVIAGGLLNTASGYAASISGGVSNTVTGDYSVVPGGLMNWATGNYSYASGVAARATNNNTFVWSDGSVNGFGSTTNNQASMLAANGYRFLGGPVTANLGGGTNLPVSGISTNGGGPGYVVGYTNGAVGWVTNGGGGSTGVVSGVVVTNSGALQPIGPLGTGGAASNQWGVVDVPSGQYINMRTQSVEINQGLIVNFGGITNSSSGDGFVGPSLYGNAGNLSLGPSYTNVDIVIGTSLTELRENVQMYGTAEIGTSLKLISPSNAVFVLLDNNAAMITGDGNVIDHNVPFTGNYSNATITDGMLVKVTQTNEQDLLIGGSLIVSNNASFSNDVLIAGSPNQVNVLNIIQLNTNGTMWLSNRTANRVPLRIDRYVAGQTTNLLEINSNGISQFVIRSNGYVGIGNSAPTAHFQVGSGFQVDQYDNMGAPVGYLGEVDSSTYRDRYKNGSPITFNSGGIDFAASNAVHRIDTYWGFTTNCITTNLFEIYSNNVLKFSVSSNGSLSSSTFEGPAYSTSTSTSSPAATEFVVAEWVRGLFINGFVGYNSSNVMVNGIGGSNYTTNFFEKFGGFGFVYSNSIPNSFTRVYSAVTNNEYLGAATITNLTQIQGPVIVSSYIGYPSGGGRSLTVKPEIYYTYGTNGYGTNELKGDWEAGAQAIAAGATNRYDWVVSVPLTVSTGGVFTLIRTFKVTAQTATPNVSIGGGTNWPSQLSYNSVMSPVGQTVYASNILAGGSISSAVGMSGTYPSNTISTVFDLLSPRQFFSTNAAASITFTGVNGFNTNGEREATATFRATGGDIDITLPDPVLTADGLRIYKVTNGQSAELTVKAWGYNTYTGAAFRNIR